MQADPAPRVVATDSPIAEIGRLRAEHGPLMFFQSGGCCDGSSPMCFPDRELLRGPNDLLFGEVDGFPFYPSPKYEGAGVRASRGFQEATVLVKGADSADTIDGERGKPIRLTFLGDESTPCSETVIFDALGRTARLPEGERVSAELAPVEPGTYGFACQMGMYRGMLVVE